MHGRDSHEPYKKFDRSKNACKAQGSAGSSQQAKFCILLACPMLFGKPPMVFLLTREDFKNVVEIAITCRIEEIIDKIYSSRSASSLKRCASSPP